MANLNQCFKIHLYINEIHLDNLLRLQEPLQPPLGEDGWRGLDVKDDHLSSHGADLNIVRWSVQCTV